MATANDKSLQDMDEHTKLDLGEVEPFAYDEHTTDVVLCVEEKKTVPFSWNFNASFSSVSQNADLKWRGKTKRNQRSRGIL